MKKKIFAGRIFKRSLYKPPSISLVIFSLEHMRSKWTCTECYLLPLPSGPTYSLLKPSPSNDLFMGLLSSPTHAKHSLRYDVFVLGQPCFTIGLNNTFQRGYRVVSFKKKSMKVVPSTCRLMRAYFSLIASCEANT